MNRSRLAEHLLSINFECRPLPEALVSCHAQFGHPTRFNRLSCVFGDTTKTFTFPVEYIYEWSTSPEFLRGSKGLVNDYLRKKCARDLTRELFYI